MFLLWGDRLLVQDPDWHARLASAGVRRLQVNIDDEPVADALRLQTFDEPVRAVVSVWTDADVAAAVVALEEAAPRVAGWVVDERRPLDPPSRPTVRGPTPWPTSRSCADPRSSAADEWLHRWLEHHTPIAIETQATFGYLQNVVVEPVTPDAPRVDALVEELFPPEAIRDTHAFYGSGGDDAELSRRMTRLMESVARFGADRDLDLVPSSRYLYAL